MPQRTDRLPTHRLAIARRFRWPALGVALVLGLLILAGLGSAGARAGTTAPTSLTTASTTTQSGKIVVDSFSAAKSIPWPFWGLDVVATHRFSTTDAGYIAKTPTKFVRFPGGALGEEYNYTSGIITTNSGGHKTADVSMTQFVSSCKAMHCHAILQLPAEIDSPSTAAYYANYVVHKLGFQPRYWEIGNAPAGWKHFQQPWSKWGTTSAVKDSPSAFATLVKQYIAAVKKVDSSARFLALGAGMGAKDYSKSWIIPLVQTNGANLAGVSVHSYILGGPSNPTAAELFANLHGKYSLPAQVSNVTHWIHDGCSSCKRIQVYVTEINAAEVSSYDKLLTTFAGPLYLAAEVTQGLALRVHNLDWFAYDSSYQGAWSQNPGKWQRQYYLFDDLLKQFQNEYLPAKLTGPSTFYAAATYNPSHGLTLFLVNLNTTTGLHVALGQAGIVIGSLVHKYVWTASTAQPQETSSYKLGWGITLAPESILMLVAGPNQLA